MSHLLHVHLHRRHHFGKIGIELRELYLSMSLQTFAMSLIGIFVPIYLYENGFSLTSIMCFFALYFGGRIFFDPLAALLVARYGPKHVMSLSYVLQIVDLLILYSIEAAPYLPMLILAALAAAIKNSLYFIAYHTDFSRVENPKSSGKALSTMSILLSLAGALGPFIGGALAYWFGVKMVFLIAICLVLAAIKPLFKTAEPVRQYRLTWRKLRVPVVGPGLRWGATGLDHFMIFNIWPLLIFLIIFRDNPYLGVGSALTIAMLITVFTDHQVGRLIDKGKALVLMRLSVLFSVVIHLWRTVIISIIPVITVNVLSDASNAGIVLSESSEYYKQASKSGSRIEYIALTEAIGNSLKTLFSLVLVLLSIVRPDTVLRDAFWVGSLFLLPLVFKRKRP